MCNENDKINMSEWTVERIQAEQDKHMSFKVTGSIPKVDIKKVECNLTELDNALDVYIRKVTEDTDMYIICEIAKLYVESLRPAEWEYTDGRWGLGDWRCSKCGGYSNKDTRYCPNCGRRMKHGV